MADEIKITFSADEKAVLAAYQKLMKENQKYREELAKTKKAADEAAKSTEKVSKGGEFLRDQGDSIASMATNFVSVNTAVSFVVDSYRTLRAETEKLGQAHKDLSQRMVGAITRAGDAAQGSRVEAALSAVRGATREQALAAYQGVTEGSPSLSLDERLAITREVAPLGVAGTDVGRFANVAGKMAQLMPHKSAGDIADLTAFLQQRTGENFDKVGGDKFISAVGAMTESGVSIEKALSLGLSGVEANLPPGAVGDLAESITANKTFSGAPSSRQDLLERRFYGLSPHKRLEALQSDAATAEAVLGVGGMLKGKALGDGSEQLASMQQAMSGDLAKQSIVNLAGFSSGREALREQQTAVEHDAATRATAMEEAQFQRAKQFVESQTANFSPIAKGRIQLEMQGVGFGARGGSVGNFANQSPADALMRGMSQMGYLSEQQIKSFQRQEQQNSEIIAELRKQNTRKNINADAHTE